MTTTAEVRSGMPSHNCPNLVGNPDCTTQHKTIVSLITQDLNKSNILIGKTYQKKKKNLIGKPHTHSK